MKEKTSIDEHRFRNIFLSLQKIITMPLTNKDSLAEIVDSWAKTQSPPFEDLSTYVIQTHQTAQSGAVRAINQMATLRNWLIGYYIVEYEQEGKDRTKYGTRLLKRLEESVNTRGLNVTLFKVSRNFHLYYPQIAELFHFPIHPMVSDESIHEKSATASHKFETSAKDILGITI